MSRPQSCVRDRAPMCTFFQNVSTVTLEVPDGVSKRSVDAFVCRILWENALKDDNGNSSEIIRMKVRVEQIAFLSLKFKTLSGVGNITFTFGPSPDESFIIH